jgi:hypothetical protein
MFLVDEPMWRMIKEKVREPLQAAALVERSWW